MEQRIGCGNCWLRGAGAAAAITAHDAGAKVIILEKTEQGGGNTTLAAGNIREYRDIDKAMTYFKGIFMETIGQDMK